jgi:dihydropteroate synthase
MSSLGDRPLGSPPAWRIRHGEIALDRPIVVGILNVTPDSFSDGGRFVTVEAAVAQAERMVAEGADVIDIGGESTRPQGAVGVSPDEEIRRTVPVVRGVRARFADIPISVDTSKSDVASAAIDEGANIINDVSAFRLDPRVREIAARVGAGVVLMHSRGTVGEMGTYKHAQYDEDVVGEATAELRRALDTAMKAGVQKANIVLDPGIGFAKRSRHSLEVLASLERFSALGCAVMIGVSRKRFIGELSHVTAADERIAGTVGANVAALMRGARLFRVHDVAPNRQALDVAWGVLHPEQWERLGAMNGAEVPRAPYPVPRSQAQ